MSRPLTIGLLLATSIAAHLPGAASPLLDYHHHRQTQTATTARNYHENGLRFLHPQIDWEGPYRGRAATEFPLYIYLVGVFWGVLGLGDLWGRILSALFSAATACLLFAFLERWMERRAAFLGAALFCLLPIEVYFGRTVQPEALALLASVGCLLALDLYLERPLPGRWLAAWAGGALALGHKLPYAYLLPVCAALAWTRLERRALRDVGLWAFFLLVAAAVYGWYRYASAGVFVVPTHKGEFLAMLEYARLPYFAQYQVLSRWPEVTVTWPGMVLIVAGAAELRRRHHQTRFFLWSWLGILFLYAVAGGGYTFRHDYTALPFAPANSAFMGLGLHALWERAGRAQGIARAGLSAAALRRAGLVLLVAAVPGYTAVRIKHWYRIGHPTLVRAQAPADAVSGPDDLFLCNERSSPLFLYYIHRRGWGHALEEDGVDPMPWIREKTAAGARFYMTRREGAFLDRNHPLSKPIFAGFPLVYEDPEFLIFKLRPG